MSDQRFTPGPWKYCGCGKCGFVYAPGADVEVARAVDENDHSLHGEGIPAPTVDVKVANARLIAAAPDLYTALKEISDGRHSARAKAIANRALARVEPDPCEC